MMLPEDLDGFIDDCLQQLRDPDPGRRLEAVACLGRLRRQGRAAVPALIELLADPDAHIRKMAALALGDIGAWEAVPALRVALKDPNESVRRRASIALDEIGLKRTHVA